MRSKYPSRGSPSLPSDALYVTTNVTPGHTQLSVIPPIRWTLEDETMRNDSLHRLYDLWCVIHEEAKVSDEAMLLGRPAKDQIVIIFDKLVSLEPIKGLRPRVTMTSCDECGVDSLADPISDVLDAIQRLKVSEKLSSENLVDLRRGEVDLPPRATHPIIIGEALDVEVHRQYPAILTNPDELWECVGEDSIDVESEFQIGVKDISHVRSSPVH